MRGSETEQEGTHAMNGVYSDNTIQGRDNVRQQTGVRKVTCPVQGRMQRTVTTKRKGKLSCGTQRCG